MLSARECAFIEARRVAHLATADSQAVPQVVPVCFGLADEVLYITIDRKPKRAGGRPLKRLRNIAENPRVAVVFDRYDEDWRRLGWVMLHGQAAILTEGGEHDRAQALLRAPTPAQAAESTLPLQVSGSTGRAGAFGMEETFVVKPRPEGRAIGRHASLPTGACRGGNHSAAPPFQAACRDDE
jgi:PPOX class probable F420-dependent enzyme